MRKPSRSAFLMIQVDISRFTVNLQYSHYVFTGAPGYRPGLIHFAPRSLALSLSHAERARHEDANASRCSCTCSRGSHMLSSARAPPFSHLTRNSVVFRLRHSSTMQSTSFGAQFSSYSLDAPLNAPPRFAHCLRTSDAVGIIHLRPSCLAEPMSLLPEPVLRTSPPSI